jgi:hypothetical protein
MDGVEVLTESTDRGLREATLWSMLLFASVAAREILLSEALIGGRW